MRVFGPKYIGRVITIQVLRAYILELELSEEDTLLLQPDNMGELEEEYRTMYREPMPQPFFLLGVYIDEADAQHPVPKDRVTVLYSDTRPSRVQLAREQTTLTDDGRTLYRCRECGNLVTPDGLLIDNPLRLQYINWLKVRGGNAGVVNVLGECCERSS